MAAGVRDLSLEQGATHRFSLQWLQPTDPPAPYDITGATARMHIRAPDNTLVLDLSDGSGIELDGPGGLVRIVITAEDSWLLTMPKAKYDLFLLLAGGDVVKLLKGKILVDPAVTDYRDTLAITPDGEPALVRSSASATPTGRAFSSESALVGPTWSPIQL